jgi:hypothetical protein
MSRDVLAPLGGVVAVLICCGVWSLIGAAVAGWTIAKLVGIGLGALAVLVVGALLGLALIRRRRPGA